MSSPSQSPSAVRWSAPHPSGTAVARARVLAARSVDGRRLRRPGPDSGRAAEVATDRWLLAVRHRCRRTGGEHRRRVPRQPDHRLDERATDPLRPSEAINVAAPRDAIERRIDVAGVVDHVAPTIVTISADMEGGQSLGTGVIISSDGEILTNAHVVNGATSIRVRLAGETEPREVNLLADGRRQRPGAAADGGRRLRRRPRSPTPTASASATR